jgi:hypothetical protein
VAVAVVRVAKAETKADAAVAATSKLLAQSKKHFQPGGCLRPVFLCAEVEPLINANEEGIMQEGNH